MSVCFACRLSLLAPSGLVCSFRACYVHSTERWEADLLVGSGYANQISSDTKATVSFLNTTLPNEVYALCDRGSLADAKSQACMRCPPTILFASENLWDYSHFSDYTTVLTCHALSSPGTWLTGRSYGEHVSLAEAEVQTRNKPKKRFQRTFSCHDADNPSMLWCDLVKNWFKSSTSAL